MSKRMVKRISKDGILAAVLALALLIIFLLNNHYTPLPSIIMDEYGYLSTAAYFAGKDWSGILSVAAYYSYGYGLLVAPLFMIIKEPVCLYYAILILNYGMLVISFFCAYSVGKMMFPTMEKNKILWICFLILLYPSNVFNAQIGWSEILLYLLFWLIALLLLKTLRKPSAALTAALAFLSVYIYVVHQRALGVLVMVVLSIATLLLLKKITWKQFISFALVLGLCWVCQSVIKEILLGTLWKTADSSMLAVNDFAGQTSKLKLLLSKDGSLLLLQGMAGRILYLAVTSLFIIFIAVQILIKNSVSIFAKGRFLSGLRDFRTEYSIFFLGAFLSTLLIAVVYMLTPGRIDQVIYGRYLEWTLGPLLLLGLGSWLQKDCRLAHKWNIIFIVIVAICGWVSYSLMNQMQVAGFYVSCSVGFTKFYYLVGEGYTKYMFLFLGIITAVFLYVLIQGIATFKKGMIYPGILIAVFWLTLSNSAVNEELSVYEDRKQIALEVASVFDQVEAPEEIYYYYDLRYDYTALAGDIQFCLPDTRIKLAGDEYDERIEEMEWVIAPTASEKLKRLTEHGFTVFYISSDIALLKAEDS